MLVSEDMTLSSWKLREAGFNYLGDAAPSARRSCWTSEPDLWSLDDLRRRRKGGERYTMSAPAGPELDLLKSIALRDGWNVTVRNDTTSANVQCGWVRPSVGGLRELSPLAGPAWRPRRVATLVNQLALVDFPRALEVLARVHLNAAEEWELRATGAAEWAEQHAALVRRWAHGTDAPDLTVAVVGHELKTAAERAKVEVRKARGLGPVRMTVMDGGCTAAGGATLAEVAAGGSGSGERALVGPPCGAGRRAAGAALEWLRVPLVLYTPSGPDAGAALRTAGDARDVAAMWGALCGRLGWRRAAILTEWAGRHQADSELLKVEPVHRVDLPDTHNTTDLAPILEVSYHSLTIQ